MDRELVRFVTDHRMLGRFPEHERANLLRQAQLRRFNARARLFDQGGVGRSVLVVIDGYTKISTATASGREVMLAIMGPGAVIGETAALNDWPRVADAETLSPCRVLMIDGTDFIRAMLEQPTAMLELIRLLSARQHGLAQQLADRVELAAPARLAKLLLQLATLDAQPVPGGLRLELRLSQRELGALTGLARESINKLLAHWRSAGWIHLDNGLIVLTQIDALRTLLHELGGNGSTPNQPPGTPWVFV